MSDTDLVIAFDTIRAKRNDLDTLFSYVDGPQPLKYSTQRLAETFQDLLTHFEINWCSVVVDATLDRIQLIGFDVQDKETNTKIAEIFAQLHLDIEADKAHSTALATSQSYIIVWKTERGTIAYYNDPRLCAVFYDSADPKKKTFAAKWFTHADGKQEITLYYESIIEHWQSEKISMNSSIDKASAFILVLTEPNTYGVIPVFELRSPGEIFKILSLQDAINKLFSDMMVASEFGAFVQRFVISQAEPSTLKNKPNEIWWLPAGESGSQDTSVGQFTPTQLTNYIAPMDKISNSIAIITRTPKHYFMDTGSNVSGEALLAMESPLVKKVLKRQREFQAQWQDIAQFILKLNAIEVPSEKIFTVWARAESVQPKTEAETRQISVNTGIPLITLLKREGWTEEEIAKMSEDKTVQQKAERTVAQSLLADIKARTAMTNPDGVDNAITTA
jgi:hypothetical protein